MDRQESHRGTDVLNEINGVPLLVEWLCKLREREVEESDECRLYLYSS